MNEILKNIVACPQCFGELQWDEASQKLICPHDKLIYSMDCGIPVLLTTQAVKEQE